MSKILFIFPPLSKNSTDLYFRTKQFFQILKKFHQVEILSAIHKRGESWRKNPLIWRILIFVISVPKYLFKIVKNDILLIFPSNFWHFWAFLGTIFGKKLILDHYVTAIYPTEDVRLPQFLKNFLIFTDLAIYKKFDLVFTHTKTMQILISKFYKIPKEKIIVIYSVVDTKLFDPERISQKVKNQIREDWKIPKSAKVALYHGTYHPFHGVKVIEAAAKILQNQRDLIFVLLGWGAAKKSQNNIIYIPYQPYERLPQFLSIANVWLGRFSNDQRGLRAASSCMLQAMAMAKTVVTGDSVENRFILEDGKAGILIQNENPKILAQTLADLLKDQNKLTLLGNFGREKILKNFSIEKMEGVLGKNFQ